MTVLLIWLQMWTAGLLFKISDANDSSGGAEFLVVSIGLLLVYVEFFEQGEADVYLQSDVLGQPDFIVHARLLDYDARALVDPRQKTYPRNCVDTFDIHLL